jgi:hypothetical protein
MKMNTRDARRHHRHATSTTTTNTPRSCSSTRRLLNLVVLVTVSTVKVTSFQVSAAVSEPRKASVLSSSSAIPAAAAAAATTTSKNNLGGMGLLFHKKSEGASSAVAVKSSSSPFFATSTTTTTTTTTSSSPTANKNKNDKDNDSNDTDDDHADYQRRKAAWAARYTSVDALRSTFGSNRNLVWGDLDAATARRLYKTLLPKALLELYNTNTGVVGMSVHPSDLAPLAYQARVAAKLYARERCALPARVAANLYDGFRQWRTYGRFDCSGMSYDQLWNKYAASIAMVDEHGDCEIDPASSSSSRSTHDGLDERDVTAKICLKILERSCETNQMIDKWVLSSKQDSNNSNPSNSNYRGKALSHRKRRAVMAQRRDLQEVTDQLEHDVRELLLLSTSTTKTATTSQNTGSSSAGKSKSKSSGESRGNNRRKSRSSNNTDDDDDVNAAERKSASSLSVRRFRLLRILARSKRRIEAMQQLNTNTAADAAEAAGTTKHDTHKQQQQQQHEQQYDSDQDSKQLPWKDRPRQTTNRRKQWMERDASTIQQRRP